MQRILELTKRMFRMNTGYVVASTIAMAVAGLLDGATVISIAPVIELMIAVPGRPYTPVTETLKHILGIVGIPFSLISIVVILGLLTLLKSLLTIVVAFLTVKGRIRFEESLKQEGFSAIIAAPWAFFAREKAGGLINTFAIETAKAGSAFTDICNILSISFQVFFGIVVLLVLSWRMTLMAAGIAIPFAFLMRQFSRYGYRFGRRFTQASQDFTASFSEFIGMIKVIKGFSAEQQTMRLFMKHLHEYSKTMLISFLFPQLVNSLADPIGFLAIVMMAFIGFHIVHLPLAMMGVFLFTLYRVVPAMSQFNVAFVRFSSNIPSLEIVHECIQRASGAISIEPRKPTLLFSQQIRFKNVSFSHTGRHRTVEDLTITIPAGHTIALVGPSGGGKSTLIDLLMGFYPPETGQILLDNQDLSECNLSSWREQIGYVPQEALLFNDTLYNNIAWGIRNSSEEDVREAARLAHVEEFVRTLPEGLQTNVGERGVMLSGGQRQRVALARALIRRPRLLILDEATSALDSESERSIQDVLHSLSGKMTMILIAHRFSTIRHSNTIYLLEHGRIVESGTFDVLIARNGRFHQLAQAHA